MLEFLRIHQDLSAVPAEDGESVAFGVDHTLWHLPAWVMDGMGFQDEFFSFFSGSHTAYISLPRSSLAVNGNWS